MTTMKNLSVLLIALMLATSCANETQTNEQEQIVPEASQAELSEKTNKLISKLMDSSELNLQLNRTDKWQIPEETYVQLMQLKQQIYVISGNMENYPVESYNEMGNEFLGFVESIPSLENAEANLELQKVISASKNQCVFLLESNLQQAQIAVINLSIIYDEVPLYFVPS